MRTEDEMRKLRKYFQHIKAMSLEQFLKEQNIVHTRSYKLAEQHYNQAMDIVLQPKQKARVLEKVETIRRVWDGIDEVTIETTEVIA